jgi:hypothetical protein
VDPIVVPEDLSDLSDDELTELGLQIQERVESLAEEARDSESALAEVENLIEGFDRVNDELTNREVVRAEREERISAALERFGPAEEMQDETDEDEDEDEVEEAAEEEEEGEEVATEEFSIEDQSDEEPEPQVARKPTVAALRARRPAAAAPPAETAPAEGAPLSLRIVASGLADGQEIDPQTLARVVTSKRHAMSNAPSGTFEKITIASSVGDFEDVLGGGPEENFAILQAIRDRQNKARDERNALVASGGNCAPLAPDYSFFRLAEELNPVEECLPVAQAPRGGIRFITPPAFTDAAPGVRVTTEAQDAAGYVSQGGPTPDKPCVAVTCPPVEECRVDAVSRCVRFGNLNYRVFPEQVEAFMKDLAVIFTMTKEVFYLDAIHANSTAVTSTPAYGAVRGMIQDLAVAAANYRRRHHMDPGATLDLLLPSWVAELVYVDMVNDHALGMSKVCGDRTPADEVACALARLGLNVCWYYDSATGAGQAFNGAQAAGPLNDFPTVVQSYLYAPGTFVRLDAGTLDVGLIRDSALNGTNDLELFAEQWIQVCMVGLESIRIAHTLCPDGTAPEPVPPLLCGQIL